jgi:hypothetical protein
VVEKTPKFLFQYNPCIGSIITRVVEKTPKFLFQYNPCIGSMLEK